MVPLDFIKGSKSGYEIPIEADEIPVIKPIKKGKIKIMSSEGTLLAVKKLYNPSIKLLLTATSLRKNIEIIKKQNVNKLTQFAD